MGDRPDRRRPDRSLAQSGDPPPSALVRPGAPSARVLELSERPRDGIPRGLRHARICAPAAGSPHSIVSVDGCGGGGAADRGHWNQPPLSGRALLQRRGGWLCRGPAMAVSVRIGGGIGAPLAAAQAGFEPQSNELTPKATYFHVLPCLNSKCPGS